MSSGEGRRHAVGDWVRVNAPYDDHFHGMIGRVVADAGLRQSGAGMKPGVEIDVWHPQVAKWYIDQLFLTEDLEPIEPEADLVQRYGDFLPRRSVEGRRED